MAATASFLTPYLAVSAAAAAVTSLCDASSAASTASISKPNLASALASAMRVLRLEGGRAKEVREAR
jgi:hypothetical protein